MENYLLHGLKNGNNIGNQIKNYLDYFIYTSLNHMSIRSCLVSQSKNKLISNSEHLFHATDLSPITFSIILSPNPRGKNSTNSQINPGTTNENNTSKPYTIKILSDSGASALIVREDVLYKRHRILKDKKNKWLTIAVYFNTTFGMESKLKLIELNHTVEIYAKCHLTVKLLNYDLILGRDILHEVGILFTFKNETIIWQEVSLSIKPSKCKVKEFFVIKESHLVKGATKMINQIFDAKYKKINTKTIAITLNNLKDKYKNSLLKLLQKYEEMFDRSLGKYKVVDYTIELQENEKPHHV